MDQPSVRPAHPANDPPADVLSSMNLVQGAAAWTPTVHSTGDEMRRGNAEMGLGRSRERDRCSARLPPLPRPLLLPRLPVARTAPQRPPGRGACRCSAESAGRARRFGEFSCLLSRSALEPPNEPILRLFFSFLFNNRCGEAPRTLI